MVDLRLVVVLDEDDVLTRRPLDQGAAPGERHGDGGRELVARRHMDVVAFRQGLAVHQPLLVHGQADKPAGPQREDIAGIGVARILIPTTVRSSTRSFARR